MKKYVIEDNIFNINDRSLSDELYEFDDLLIAVKKLNDSNVFTKLFK